MTVIEKLKARLRIAEERNKIARKYLDEGGIILTKLEAEELLTLVEGLLHNS